MEGQDATPPTHTPHRDGNQEPATFTSDRPEQNSDDGYTTTSEDLLRTLAMLALVSVGIAIVLCIFFWPLAMAFFLPIPKNNATAWAVTAEVVHFTALVWVPFPYLYFHRKVCHPIRALLMPLVHEVAKSEAIRERESTWYNKCTDLPRTRDAGGVLRAFRGGVRRDLKRKLTLFFEQGITTKTTHSDYLSLMEDVPIIWAHEKRAVRGTDKSAVEEFIKRFLVIFLVCHAYIDRYYDRSGQICALGQFVASEKTLNSFVYFCLEQESQSGIWQYHNFRQLLRALAAYPELEYVNHNVHQGFAKRLAGAIEGDYRDAELLNDLYPFALFREPPPDVIDLEISPECLNQNPARAYS